MARNTIDGATYTLDNAGNRTAKTDQRTAVATSYGYDNIYQLLSATPSSGTAESYSYDPVGNRLSSLGVSAYSVNASKGRQQYVSIRMDANLKHHEYKLGFVQRGRFRTGRI